MIRIFYNPLEIIKPFLSLWLELFKGILQPPFEVTSKGIGSTAKTLKELLSSWQWQQRPKDGNKLDWKTVLDHEVDGKRGEFGWILHSVQLITHIPVHWGEIRSGQAACSSAGQRSHTEVGCRMGQEAITMPGCWLNEYECSLFSLAWHSSSLLSTSGHGPWEGSD